MTNVTEYRKVSKDGLLVRVENFDLRINQSNGWLKAEFYGIGLDNANDPESEIEIYAITMLDGRVVYTNRNGFDNLDNWEQIIPYGRVKQADGSYKLLNLRPAENSADYIRINYARVATIRFVGEGLQNPADLNSTVNVWRVALTNGESFLTSQNYADNF